MTRQAAIAFVLLLVLSAVAPAVGTVAAQPANQTETGTTNQSLEADLAVETPTGDVSTSRSNGTTRYTASAGPLELHPQNFDEGDVVDFGADAPGATLGYQSEYGQFEYSANRSGTSTVWWVVAETVQDGNETTQVQRRYEAEIRLTDDATTATMTEAELQGLRADAEKWEEFNASYLQEAKSYDSPYATEPESDEEAAQRMLDAYKTQHNIFAALSGNFTDILVLLVLTMGGWLFLALILVYHFSAIGTVSKRLNRYIRSEAQEGDLQDKRTDLQHMRDQMALENTDLQDIPGITDREAQAFRDAMDGESLRDWVAGVIQDGPLSVVAIVLYRLHGMGHDGYDAIVDECSSEPSIELVEPDGDLPDGLADTEPVTTLDDTDGKDRYRVDLAGMGPDIEDLLLRQIESWDHGAVTEWSILDSDVEPGDVEYHVDSLNLEALQQDLGIDQHRFDNEEAFGEALMEIVEHVEQHPSMDRDGSPNPTRHVLERLLKVDNHLADKYRVPICDMQRDAISAALANHDPGKRIEQTTEDITSGRGVGAD